MTRRDALLRLTAVLGGTIFGAHRFLTGTVNGAETSSPPLLSAGDLALLNAVAETILPTTPDSAGAGTAGVASFMKEIVRDFYDDRERAAFREGVASLHPHRFTELAAGERHSLLLALDRATPQPEYYRMMKQLTIWGYFSSEIGATQALIHVPVPGAYQGCIDVEPGARAWAN